MTQWFQFDQSHLSSQQPLKILLLEDNLDDVIALRRFLLRAGKTEWEIVQVEQLSEAIALALQTQTPYERNFDVVLLDLSLPDSLGLDTLKEFRAAVPFLPIVVLTGFDDEAIALQALSEGAQEYLVKGQITMQWLVRAICSAIEREQILRQLRDSEQRSREALQQQLEFNQLKSNLFSMISHEFRTPITTVLMTVELLQNHCGPVAEAQRGKYYQRIRTSVQQLLDLLDEVLLLSKAEAGKLECYPVPIDLVTFCCNLTDTLQLNAGDRCTLHFTFEGDCNQAMMDEALLHRIFSNLLSNAIKYSPKHGTVQFRLLCRDGMATFQIQDQGIGIPSEEQRYLFDSFHRCSNAKEIPGSGLGLAIVKQCVELHGGAIQVESEEGLGTTFTVQLPLKEPSCLCWAYRQ